MKKKIMLVCMMFLSIFLLAGCGSKEKENNSQPDNSGNDNVTRLSGLQAENIKSAAENWQLDNMILAPGEGRCSKISLAQLQQEGYADPGIDNLGTWVKISRVSGTFLYDVTSADVGDCKTIE